MSEKDNFGTGFLLGTIIGGVVGGIVGTFIANKNNDHKKNEIEDSELKTFDEERMENSRISLEERINQLNHAIDEVRFTLTKNSQREFNE